MPGKKHISNISNISFKIIRHYRNARMTLIGHASLAMRIRAANVSGFAEYKKAPRRITPIHIARVAEDISLKKKDYCMMRIKCHLWLLARGFRRSKKGPAAPSPACLRWNSSGLTGIGFLRRQLPTRHCISRSQLTIIASYRIVAAVKSVPAARSTRFGSFDATRLTRTQILRLRLCSMCANKVTSCRCSFGPHTHRDRFRVARRRATNFE